MGFLPFFPRRFFKLQSRKTKGFVFSSHGIQGFDVIKAIRRAKHHLAVPPTAEGKLEWILLIGLIENRAPTVIPITVSSSSTITSAAENTRGRLMENGGRVRI